MTVNKIKPLLLLLIISTLIFAACSSKDTNKNTDKNTDTNKDGNEQEEALFEVDASIEGDITFWTWTPAVYEDIVPAFNKEYPNINVKVVGVNLDDMHNNLQNTLAAGTGAPDVSQVVQGQFARYSTGDLLDDLLQPPYNAGKYKDLVSEYNWERWKSVDGKRLVGMPWDVTPGVFYYRADLYEQVGLPSDPKELGEFLSTKENVLDAAQTLKANDIYMFDWRDLPAVQYGDSIGYFDTEYNWLRNTDEMADMIDFTKQGIQIGWAPQLGYMSDEGKQLVNQGKLASVTKGSFAARDLAINFPEQAGKWRATTMPLGLSVGLGGSSFVIPSQGENKEAAWAFVQWMVLSETAWEIFAEHSVQPSYKHITSLPWYQEHTNEFLGDQQDFKLYTEIERQIPVRRLTPLDGRAWTHYIEGLNESINNNVDSKAILQQIEDAAMREFATEIEELKAEMAKVE